MAVAENLKNQTTGFGSPDSDLTTEEMRAIVESALADIPAGAKVLAIIADKTRDDNTPILFPIAAGLLRERRAAKFDALVAQGTHPPMSDADKLAMIGASRFSDIPLLGSVFDHHWDDPEQLATIGTLAADDVDELTGGLLTTEVPLTVNRHVIRYDHILIFGGTVPHEVAGFAGGAKYFFPGIAGPELTNATHWLGACATIERIIGRVETPTRRMIEAAADHIPANVISFTSVITRDDEDRQRTHALFAGDCRLALRRAAEVSRMVHIKYTGRKYKCVVALLDEHYEDLWVGGKASYKLGGVIEDGGELIIFAPQLKAISDTHGDAIERFGGYAPLEVVRERVEHDPELRSNLCVAAHLAHVSFAGRRLDSGEFVSRYRITLASQVDADTCRRVNLNYLDPGAFRVADYENDPNSLIVERAGRDLYLVEPQDE